MSIRIVVVDDHQIVREGLCALLKSQPDLEVMAEAGDGREGLNLCRKLKPDVMIADVGMPELNGIEATRQLKADAPSVKVVALSVHMDRRFVSAMLQAGASAYVIKKNAFKELAQAIYQVMNGHTYLSPQIADLVVEDYIQLSAHSSPSVHRLTAREREVLQLLAEGRSAEQVADRLYLSVNTISTHRRHIMEKLGLSSISELTKYAIREGLTSLEG